MKVGGTGTKERMVRRFDLNILRTSVNTLRGQTRFNRSDRSLGGGGDGSNRPLPLKG